MQVYLDCPMLRISSIFTGVCAAIGFHSGAEFRAWLCFESGRVVHRQPAPPMIREEFLSHSNKVGMKFSSKLLIILFESEAHSAHPSLENNMLSV